MKKPEVILVLRKRGKVVGGYLGTTQVRNYLNRWARLKFKKGMSGTLTVIYGGGKDALGKSTVFENSGTYKSLNDLAWAYRAFMNKELWQS